MNLQKGSRTDLLNSLFAHWRQHYAEDERAGFHPDGIVDETTFDLQQERVVFLLKEPNSTDGMYDKYRGVDLRDVYGYRQWTKQCNQNVARWTQCILDGVVSTSRITGKEADKQNCRIAIMNFKKISGSGVANGPAIEKAAWDSRAFIREQLKIMAPTVVFACSRGGSVSKMLFRILHDDFNARTSGKDIWRLDGVTVIPAYHPSARPLHNVVAIEHLQRLCKKAAVGAYRSRSNATSKSDNPYTIA